MSFLQDLFVIHLYAIKQNLFLAGSLIINVTLSIVWLLNAA